MSKSKIAAQLYTLRDYMKTPEDIENSLKKVKEIGFEAIQVSGIGEIDPYRLKDIVDEIGLVICCTHTNIDKLENNLSEVIAYHKLWNCGYIGLGSLTFGNSYEEAIASIERLKKIGQNIKENGLRFIYHNHHREFNKYDGKTIMDIIASKTDKDEVGFLVDTYWVQAGGADPAQFINNYGNRIPIVHLKDMSMSDDKQIMTEVGEGNMNFAAIISQCEKIGVKWYAIEQDTCRTNPFNCLKTSFLNLKRMGLC